MIPKENSSEPQKEHNPRQLAESFVKRLNDLLASIDEGGTLLQVEPEHFLPLFTKSIEKILATQSNTHFPSVLLVTQIDLFDLLEAQNIEYLSMLNVYTNESLDYYSLELISRCLRRHPDFYAKYLSLDLFDKS